MPTICFNERNFDKTERTILTRTFRQNCRDLGIVNRDASIYVSKFIGGSPAQLGAITRLGGDSFKMIINRLNDPMRSIFCIGHEMVHFDQYTRGDLIDDNANGIVRWRGKTFPAWMLESRDHYDNLPWEIEAASKHDGLMESAMRSLLPYEREYVCNTAIAA